MNILLVSSSSWAGMGPYASEIINLFSGDTNVYYFLIEDERRFFSKNISKGMRDRGIILYKENSGLNKLLALFFPPYSIVKALKQFCIDNNIDVIHFLTSEVPYCRTILELSQQYKVFFTVHDLHPHEAKKVFYKQFRQKMMYRKLTQIRCGVNNLITNSRSQEVELKGMFPEKKVYYHEFPSLINSAIIEGKMIPKELNGAEDYILFFGRIEMYKGVDMAYEAFSKNLSLRQQTLVIAGSGDLYFPVDNQKNPNIIIINRYIKDEEVAYLFNHARFTLYPYISATQSGVLSVSSYFGKPIIASDVPFFKSVEQNGLGCNFNCGDKHDMIAKIMSMLSIDTTPISRREKEYYQSNFSKQSLHKSLLEIYSK